MINENDKNNLEFDVNMDWMYAELSYFKPKEPPYRLKLIHDYHKDYTIEILIGCCLLLGFIIGLAIGKL